MKRVFVLLFASCLVAAAGVGAYLFHDYNRWLDEPLSTESGGQTLLVPSGASFRALVRQLEQEGLLDNAHYFEFLARTSDRAGSIQAGEYHVAAGTTPAELLRKLARGRVVQHRFTIIEGWTFSQLRTALEADPRIVHTLDEADDAEVMRRLEREGEHPEGWFLPETYHFTRGTEDIAILRRALNAMEERLQGAWEQRERETPLKTPYEALILASIIERETGRADERRKVSGVFVRRLEQRMRLQTDPTVIYGMGDAYDGRIRTRDLRTDTPYNTYTRHGLTPTPIAMPSGASIDAALDPKDGDALYFVSRGDGSHHFSATLDEHNRAVRRYILNRED